MLVNLDSGPLPEEELKKSECLWYEDESDHSKLKVVLENSNENTFEGSVNLNSKICRTMLVLHNKKKNKVQLVDLIECQLQKALSKPTLQSNYDNDEIETTYEDNRNKLLKQFGSKRANRASDIGSKMRINSEMMTTQIKHTAADVSVDVSEIQMADSSTDHCLPVCHRDATNLEGVYRYEDFFTESEWASLEDEATVVFNVIPFTQEESGFSKLIIDYIDRLGNRVTLEKIKCMLFIDVLIKFFNCPQNRFKKRDIVENICPFSNLIAKKIFEEFTEDNKGGRLRNVTMDDKVVIHILVLIIITCEFSCNTEELSRYLPRFSVKKIREIARALSLTTKDKITWFLKLPLPPQRSVFMRRRKN
ncbi:DNA-directed RNA polymerase I subunit RPA49-like isoform X2 [Macrosteles quadrilineatus]|uniref:DNA-directed RNA polymerase I subunit RPA49-like isoform X2 n=1 Tax=Macrosteles quadrilineatus TaxID=74068 RepID=UPI0023E29B76|nr:DNA-directed RNA polymerase I subunit RPA49-like isoform X2 [Macrosteles quadrilineatus]